MHTHRITTAGVTLAVDDDGPAGTPVTLILHGFTGSAAAMAPVAEGITASGTRVLVPDLVGHGRSDAPAEVAQYSMSAAVEQLVGVLDHLDIALVDLLGYSMGGRLALTMAVDRPGRVRSLQLVSASPGLAAAADQAARVEADERLADRIEAEGVESFVDEWIENPLFASQKRLPESVQRRARDQRLLHSARGLANSLRGMGTGAMRPLHDELAHLPMPVSIMAGALDPKFVAIAQAIELKSGWQRTIVDDCGHALYLEAPSSVYLGAVEFQNARHGRKGLG